MALYHVFLTYTTHDHTEQTLLQYNISKVELHEKILTPIHDDHSFFFIGHLIKPATIHQLKIYTSEREYQNLILPSGLSPLGQPHEYIMYYFDQNLVDGVVDVTETQAIVTHQMEKQSVQPQKWDGEIFSESQSPPPTTRQSRAEIQLRRQQNLVIFGLCSFSYLGNLLYMVLQRWVDSQNPIYFAIVYRENSVLTFWSVLSSAIVFALLFVSTFFLSNKGKPSSTISLSNTIILIIILIVNIPINFNLAPSEHLRTEYPIIVYVSPYLLMVGEIALITYTLFLGSKQLLIKEKEFFHQEITKLLSPVVATPFVIMTIGILITFLTSTTLEWKMIFPIWFGHLIFGSILWIVSLHLKIRELQRELSVQT